MGDQFWENPLEVSVRNGNLTFKGCKMTQLVGDGYCNDETNNIHCNFDGGDCCHSYVVKSFCSECKCLTGKVGGEIHHPFLWDGYCHDETNKAEFNYDGGDCCLSNVNRDYCFNCTCFVNGFITSPGFPQNYPNNLDLTWHIELPLGQYIKIKFISFDLGLKCEDSSWFDDSLTLYDGNSKTASKIDQYDCNLYPPSQIISSRNEIFIHFFTKSVNTYPGFKLEYHPFSKLVDYTKKVDGICQISKFKKYSLYQIFDNAAL